jgi:predicted transposase YdaD
VQEGPGPRPFDVATKRLIADDPKGWLSWVGLTVDGPVQPLESDVSTVLADVDKVFRVEAASPWIAHLEVQVSHDPRLPSRLLQYYALLRHRYTRPVESTIVLLRPEADGPELLSGRLEQHGMAGNLVISFWFRVVRLWERPVDELLSGGIGILPLAPLADVERDRLPAVIRRIDERFAEEASPSDVGDLWSATLVLLGLRYDEHEARQLLRGVRGMRESSTYQAILEEGRVEGEIRGRVVQARRDVLELGTEKFGPPGTAVVERLDRIENPDILGHLLRGILRASTWQELLASAPDR